MGTNADLLKNARRETSNGSHVTRARDVLDGVGGEPWIDR